MTTKSQIVENRAHALRLVALLPRKPSELRDHGVRRGVMPTLVAYGLVEYREGASCSRYYVTATGRKIMADLASLRGV